MNEQPPIPPVSPQGEPAQQVSQPQAPSTQVSPYASMPAPQGKRSLLWLWITLPIVLILLAVGAFIAIAYPGIQARAVATNFMDAVRDDNDAKMKELSGSGSDTLTKSATAGLKGASYNISDVKNKDIGFVVNFAVKNSETLKDTTVVVKSGKVTTFNLNSTGKTTVTDTAKDTTVNPSTVKCLTVSDLQNADISYIDQEALDAGVSSGNGTYLDNIYFKPDSNDTLSDFTGSAQLDKIAKVYNVNKGKTFFYMVRGSVRESSSTAAGQELANQRAAKVKNELIARGVPADMVRLYNPISGASSTSDDIDRRIEVNINISECSASAATSTAIGR